MTLRSDKEKAFLPAKPKKIEGEKSVSKAFNLQDFKFLENELNAKYDNVSYHWKWFMVPIEDLRSYQRTYNIKQLPNQIVLAESGVSSRFSIHSVEIESFVGANYKSRNVSAYNINLGLKESFGMTLFDKLLEAAALAGSPNIQETPTFISLGFTGYDEAGQPVDSYDQFLWYVKLLDIAPESELNGTMYQIQMVPMSDVAHNKDTFNLRETIIIREAENVGEFIDKFEREINKTEEKFKGYIKNLRLLEEFEDKFYNIRIESGSKIGFKNFRDLKFRKGNASEASTERDGNLEFKLEKGWSISRVIDSMYANLEDFSEGAHSGEKATKQAYELQTIPKITSRTNYGLFLPETQEYGKNIEYIIRPFTVSRIIPGEKPDDKTQQKRTRETLEQIKDLGLLQKRYDYIFSGLNTEVLDTAISLDTLWAVSMSLSPAMLAFRSDDRRSREKPTDLSTKELDKQELKDLNIVQLWALRRETRDVIEEKKASSNAFSRSETVISKNDRILSETIAEKEKSLSSTSRSASDLNFAQGRVLLESTNETLTEDVYSQLEIKPRYELRTDPPFERYTINATKPDIGVHKRVTVLEQAYDKRGSLLTIELEIKGDPFWLGPTALEASKIKLGDNTRLTRNAKYEDGENSFYFEYRTPTGVDDETGLVDIIILRLSEAYIQ